MIAETTKREKANCRYCKINKTCTLFKVTAKRGINKKLVTWGTWICDNCNNGRKPETNYGK